MRDNKEMATNENGFEARCEMYAASPAHAALIAAARDAEDPKALAKAKRAFLKASDAGETTLPDGVFFHFYEIRKAQLAAMSAQPRSAEEARADQILRVRDSSGRARARR